MSSDDRPTDRISPELLASLQRETHVDTLTRWDGEPWDHDIGAATIRDSVFGKLRLPIVHSGEVIHGTDIVEAERVDPKDDGRVLVIDLTDTGWPIEKARAWALGQMTADQTATRDDHLLAELVLELRAENVAWTDAAGWAGDDIDELLASLQDQPQIQDVTDPPAPLLEQVERVTKPGDAWTFGDHLRLVVGDSADPAVWERLLDGWSEVNVAFTSPPYADRREYDEASGFQPIPPEEYVKWFAPIAANAARHLAEDGSWFVNIKPSVTPDFLDTETYVVDLVLAHVRAWGWHWAAEFCWERDGVPGQVTLRFRNAYEPVYQFTRGRWKMRPEQVRHESVDVPSYRGGRDAGSWTRHQGRDGDGAGVDFKREMGLAYPSNRLPTFAGSAEAVGHAAAFPVGLPAFFIQAYTDEGDVVVDPFCGSGSTLLAAHQLGRRGAGIELSPKYADLIAARVEMATGIVGELNGRSRSMTP
ncbi:MAG: site-specific DNA-methyltransferase [Actinomycetota bacterium]